MAKCGCTTFTVCSCVIVGDISTARVVGSGHAIAPYQINIVGYPNPRPTAVIYREAGAATPLSLTNNVSTVIPGAASLLSQPSMWDGSTKLIAPLAGTYLLGAGSANASLSTGGATINFIDYRIRLNGTTILDSQCRPFNENFAGGAGSLATIHRLVANDYIELLIYLGTAAGTITLLNSFLEMRWMGL
jgi:hypothetical protein